MSEPNSQSNHSTYDNYNYTHSKVIAESYSYDQNLTALPVSENVSASQSFNNNLQQYQQHRHKSDNIRKNYANESETENYQNKIKSEIKELLNNSKSVSEEKTTPEQNSTSPGTRIRHKVVTPSNSHTSSKSKSTSKSKSRELRDVRAVKSNEKACLWGEVFFLLKKSHEIMFSCMQKTTIQPNFRKNSK